VNYLEISSYEDFIDVMFLSGMISVGAVYTFRSLNVSKHWGVKTNHRLCNQIYTSSSSLECGTACPKILPLELFELLFKC